MISTVRNNLVITGNEQSSYHASGWQNIADERQAYNLFVKKGAVIFLQAVIVLTGTGAVAALLREPWLEGRNAHATLFNIYFKDPFLVYVYIASIPFFVALGQMFKALGYVVRNKAFSPKAVKAMQTVKYCAAVMIVFTAIGEIFIGMHDSDDRAGGVFMGILISFGAAVMMAAAMVCEGILQSGLDLSSENGKHK